MVSKKIGDLKFKNILCYILQVVFYIYAIFHYTWCLCFIFYVLGLDCCVLAIELVLNLDGCIRFMKCYVDQC
jgi:hypothetical protein